MPSTYILAYDESMEKLQAALVAGGYSELEVEWPNVKPLHNTEQEQPTESSPPWIRVQWQHASNIQKTIGSANGLRRYEVKGLLTVSHFSASGRGLAATGAFSKFLYDAFLGTTTQSGVLYKPHSPRDVQQDGLWYRSDAMIEFQYDEVK